MWLNKFFTEGKHRNMLFLKSICIGILIWCSFYIFTPVNVINPLSSEAIWFILLNYITLILGYFLTDLLFKKKTHSNTISKKSEEFIYVVIGLLLFSFVTRYIDLFFIREVSFFYKV